MARGRAPTTRGGERDSNSKVKVYIQKSCIVVLAFAFGFLTAGSLFLSVTTVNNIPSESSSTSTSSYYGIHHELQKNNDKNNDKNNAVDSPSLHALDDSSSGSSASAAAVTNNNNNSHNILNGVRILIAIASFDFSQLPHLEEVIDGYQDLCTTGATKVDIVIHTTVPYRVTLIDLFNSRLLPSCQQSGILTIQIIVKSPALRLHLVDCHRTMFYEMLNEYDLFIYTEDDIRVTPRTVAAYLEETSKVEHIVGSKEIASNYNVGIVRYEYNFPSNVVIDDKTRHATQNVTRVYWEHGQFPVFSKAMGRITSSDVVNVNSVRLEEKLGKYVYMKNHHQGMFLATQDLLKAWKVRKGCEFHIATNRPGMKNRPGQPSEGTQRVWMSSQMLYGGSHCNVQQVIPADSFGTLTVLHLPNKNYRRVGHFRNRTFSDGTETFDFGGTGKSLLTAMQLHLEMKKQFTVINTDRTTFTKNYNGIRMIDECSCSTCDHHENCSPLLESRMDDYQKYVERGGILSEEDMTKLDLI